MTDGVRHELDLSIQCAPPVAACPVDRRRIRRWALAALRQDAQLTIRFVGSREGRRLNNEYRGRDYATNVLTFPYDESSADIVVCVPVVEREARAQGKRFDHHLAHLVIHGVLHAQGFDHDTDDDAVRMESFETALLRRFRVPDPYRGDRGQPGDDLGAPGVNPRKPGGGPPRPG
jgi:probable rRNA maturation factor